MGLDITHFRLVTPLAGIQIDRATAAFFVPTDLGPKTSLTLRFWQRAALVYIRELIAAIYICDSESDATLLQELLSSDESRQIVTPYALQALVRVTDHREIDEQLADIKNQIPYPIAYTGRYKELFTSATGQEFRSWVAIYEGWMPTAGILGEEIGSQRSGMSEAFYAEFENDRAYAELADYMKLLECVEANRPGAIVVRENLRLNFLKRFIPGETFFTVSW
jgi:hypothetical protein